MALPSVLRSSAFVLLVSLGALGGACRKVPQPIEAVDGGPADAGIEDAGPLDGGPPAIGSACTSDAECGSGHCDLQPTGGYCIDACTTNTDCPEGSSCQQIGRGTAYCLALCHDSDECRDDYTCQSIAATCIPAAGCTKDEECPEGSICNENSGFCTGAIGARYHVGSTCTGDNQCVVGPYPFCISPDMNFTDGYCSSVCSNDGQCGARAVCVAGLITGENYKICMQSCASNSDCRDQYNCLDRNDQKFCIAWCVVDADCINSGDVCEPSTGLCHGPPDAGMPDAGPVEADAGVEPIDAGEPVDAGVFVYDGGYPAPFPAPPQVIWSGGPVLRQPDFIPIFFSNDVPEQVTKIEDFVNRVGSSTYWAAITHDYGVGTTSASPSIHLDEISTGTITDDGIQQWLREHIRGNLLPQPDNNTMYLLHYPWSMTIVLQGSRSCRGFGGYHSNFKLADGRQVVYAVMPRCGDPADENLVAQETMAESHEMIEAATDPQPFGQPGYGTVDDAHYEWAEVIGGGEVGDMCQQDPASYVVSTELGHSVQRSWSNSSATAGHDPCVPALGEPYFNAAPDLPDTLPVFVGGGFVNAKSAHVPVGGSKTITLFLYSDSDTGGPWDVRIQDYGALGGGNSPFSYSLDRTSGTNGDQLRLTIKSKATTSRTGIFLVRSTLGSRSHGWIGLADQ